MDPVCSFLQHLEGVQSSLSNGEVPSPETLSLLKSLALDVQLSLEQLQTELQQLKTREINLKSSIATERERASNAEAGKAELSVRNRALQVELDSSRQDVVRLKSRLRELDPARPRAGTSGSQIASPPEILHASPPQGRASTSSAVYSDTGEKGRDKERSGLYRSRTQTQESGGSQGSFTNLASLLARGVSTSTALAPAAVPAQVKAHTRASPPAHRSRSGSAPQPLSPSRVPWPRALMHQHGTQSAILEAVHYSGRASPLVFTSQVTGGGDSAEPLPPAPLAAGLGPRHAKDGRQLPDILTSTIDDWAAGLEPQGPLTSLPRPKPIPEWSAFAALVKPKASSGGRARAESGQQSVQPATASCSTPSVADVTAANTSTGEATVSPEVEVLAATPAPSSPVAAASPDRAAAAAASPAVSPPPPAAWSSVATMWSSWVSSGMQSRLAQQGAGAHVAASPAGVTPQPSKDSAAANIPAPSSPTAIQSEADRFTVRPAAPVVRTRSRSLPSVLLRAVLAEELAYIGLATGGASYQDSSASAIQHAVHNVLENFPLFASMSTAERHIVLASTQRVHAQAGEAVCSNSNSTASVSEQSLLFIFSGEVAVLSPHRSTSISGTDNNSEISVLHAGAYFSSADVPAGAVAMARTATLLVVLSVSTLYTLLDWFGRARHLERTSKTTADSLAALPSLASMNLFSSRAATSSASKTAESKVSAVMSAAVDLTGYLAGLRRVSPWVHSLSMPARSGIVPRAGQTATSKRLSESAIKKEVEQAHKDLGREGGILVNGEFLPLGTQERLQHFLSYLADVVRTQMLPVLHEASPGAADETAAAERESMVSSVVCDLIVAVSRTVTGGDTFVQVNSLFGRPELAFIAAESGGQAPTELTVQGAAVTILAVNTFKVCAMEAEYDVVSDAVEESSSSSSRPAARSRASTNASIPGHAGVWALLRCKLEEKSHYGSLVEEQATPAPVLSAAYMAMTTMWTKPAPPAVAGSGGKAGTAEAGKTAIGQTGGQASPEDKAGDTLRVISSERNLGVSIHVFDRPE